MKQKKRYTRHEIRELINANGNRLSGLSASSLEELGARCYPMLFQKREEFRQIDELLLSDPDFRTGYLASAWDDTFLSGKERIVRFSDWLIEEINEHGLSHRSSSVVIGDQLSLFRVWQDSIREYEMPCGYDSLEVLNSLAVAASDEYVGLLRKLPSWTLRTRFLVQPLIRSFSNSRRGDLEQRIIPRIVDTINRANVSEFEKGLIVLTVAFGILAWMHERAVKTMAADCQFGLSLLRSVLVQSFNPTMMRVTLIACLLSALRGEVEDLELEEVSNEQSLHMWLFNQLISDQKTETVSLDDVCQVFGCPPIQWDAKTVASFVECGTIDDNRFDYSIVFLVIRHLELSLEEEDLRKLCISCFAYPSGPFYWHLPKNRFPVLIGHLATAISEQSNPIAFVRSIRDRLEAMLYRMRTTRESNQFVLSCHVIEVYLMSLVFVIDEFLNQHMFPEAKDLFELGWKDCVVGLHVGEYGRWARALAIIQYLFFYKVTHLDPHFKQWNNRVLLDSLPVRNRDTDELTIRECCIAYLVRNESAIHKELIAENDQELNDEIGRYKQKTKSERIKQ